MVSLSLAYTYKKGVLHCNISISNLLLNKNLNIKLYNFQGMLLHSNSIILLNSSLDKGIWSFIPYLDLISINWKTNIFALGLAIYFIPTGHPPFLESNS